jgi:short-subunit dehydrogenase
MSNGTGEGGRQTALITGASSGIGLELARRFAASMESSKLFSGLLRVADAASVARAGYEGFRAGKRVIVPGLLNKVAAQSIRVTPRALAAKVVKKMQEGRR